MIGLSDQIVFESLNFFLQVFQNNKIIVDNIIQQGVGKIIRVFFSYPAFVLTDFFRIDLKRSLSFSRKERMKFFPRMTLICSESNPPFS